MPVMAMAMEPICVTMSASKNVDSLAGSWSRRARNRLVVPTEAARQADRTLCADLSKDASFERHMEVMVACGLRLAFHGVLDFRSARATADDGESCAGPMAKFTLIADDPQFPRVGSLKMSFDFDGGGFKNQYVYQATPGTDNPAGLGVDILLRGDIRNFFETLALNGKLKFFSDRYWREQTSDLSRDEAWVRLSAGAWIHRMAMTVPPIVLKFGDVVVPICQTDDDGREVSGPTRSSVDLVSECPSPKRPTTRPTSSSGFAARDFSILIRRY